MALLTAVQISQAGVVVTPVAAAATDTVAPAPYLEFEYTNGAGAPVTATVNRIVPSNYGTDADLVVSITNGTTKRFGLGYDPSSFVDPATGLISVALSSATTITVAVTKR